MMLLYEVTYCDAAVEGYTTCFCRKRIKNVMLQGRDTHCDAAVQGYTG